MHCNNILYLFLFHFLLLLLLLQVLKETLFILYDLQTTQNIDATITDVCLYPVDDFKKYYAYVCVYGMDITENRIR